LRSDLLIRTESVALVGRASMQITGKPSALSSCQSQVAVGPVSKSGRVAARAAVKDTGHRQSAYGAKPGQWRLFQWAVKTTDDSILD
jgi:hypothetical protein